MAVDSNDLDSNFALAWAVPPGLSNIAYKTYFIFGTFNFAAFLHIFFMYREYISVDDAHSVNGFSCVAETVGRSLEEIEEVFAQGHVFSPWKIGRDVGKKTLAEVAQANKGLGGQEKRSVEKEREA